MSIQSESYESISMSPIYSTFCINNFISFNSLLFFGFDLILDAVIMCFQGEVSEGI